MERYDGYYVNSPKGRPAIGKIIIRIVPDSATAMAELLGGRSNWIWKFSPDQFDAVARTPNLQATRSENPCASSISEWMRRGAPARTIH